MGWVGWLGGFSVGVLDVLGCSPAWSSSGSTNLSTSKSWMSSSVIFFSCFAEPFTGGTSLKASRIWSREGGCDCLGASGGCTGRGGLCCSFGTSGAAGVGRGGC